MSRPRRLSKEQVQAILRSTDSSRVVGLKFGVSGAMIRQIWARLAYTDVPVPDDSPYRERFSRPGEQNGRALLTAPAVRYIRRHGRRVTACALQSDVAKLFDIDVTEAAIYAVLQRRSWRHVA